MAKKKQTTNKLKVSIRKDVSDRHRERIKDVVQSSKLKNISKNWMATLTDLSKDRVYITDMNTKHEYSISFKDSRTGYSFSIYRRKPINDKQYEMLIKERPEYACGDRDSIASVVMVDEGFKKVYLEPRENYFLKILKEKNIELGKESGDITVFAMGSPDRIHNSLIVVLPGLKKLMVGRQIQPDVMDGKIKDFIKVASLSNGMIKTPTIVQLAISNIELTTDDAIEYFEEKKFTVESMSYNKIEINSDKNDSSKNIGLPLNIDKIFNENPLEEITRKEYVKKFFS